MSKVHNSSQVPLVRSFAPPHDFPISGTTEHDVFFPTYSRVPAPTSTMSPYLVQTGTHHSRSRSQSLSRQPPVIYTSTHHSRGSHDSRGSSGSHGSRRSHGSHHSHRSHGSHGSHGRHHSRSRHDSRDYDTHRRHHSLGPGTRVVYPTTTHHYSTGAPTYVVSPHSPHGNVLHHRQAPVQIVDTRHHRHHSTSPVVPGNQGHTHYPYYSHDYNRRYSEPSLGERIRRFFHGFGHHPHSHTRSKGFEYTDARTGHPVDVRGRPIYRV